MQKFLLFVVTEVGASLKKEEFGDIRDLSKRTKELFKESKVNDAQLQIIVQILEDGELIFTQVREEPMWLTKFKIVCGYVYRHTKEEILAMQAQDLELTVTYVLDTKGQEQPTLLDIENALTEVKQMF